MSLIWNRTVDWSVENWRDQSACRDVDPSLFFPAGSHGEYAVEQIEKAKSICNVCAVKSECLEFALQGNQENGIWGGTSEDERRRIRRQWLAAKRREKVSASA